ncbi:hypothetical protein HD806DRAFT_46864 [Xylariaceae sp. AK1471]|nr:hypothetical protein HD806DRAFT_46864 [Xylariaceae sp. AK1471]
MERRFVPFRLSPNTPKIEPPVCAHPSVIQVTILLKCRFPTKPKSQPLGLLFPEGLSPPISDTGATLRPHANATGPFWQFAGFPRWLGFSPSEEFSLAARRQPIVSTTARSTLSTQGIARLYETPLEPETREVS